MSKIAIVTQSCKYFAAPFLADALNADLYTIDLSQNDFFGPVCPVKKFRRNQTIICDHLIVIGTRALQAAVTQISRKVFKTVAVIFSDTNCCVYRKWWNKFVKENGITVYAMPDLFNYCDDLPYPIYQIFKIPVLRVRKIPDVVTIAHSPGRKAIYKGTARINEEILKLKEKYLINYIVSESDSWIDCLKVKAKSDIFIDQLIYGNPAIPQKRFGGERPYLGSLGKSGLEAMHFNCCVVTGGHVPTTEPYFPRPPAVYTTYNNFYDDIKKLVEETELRKALAAEQKVWAKDYLSYDFMSKYVTRHIHEAV